MDARVERMHNIKDDIYWWVVNDKSGTHSIPIFMIEEENLKKQFKKQGFELKGRK